MASSEFIEVVINGTTYKVPKASANPPYGEELSDYLVALGDAFASIVGVGDIPETAATINNTQASPLAINGLSFDSAQVRSAAIEYQITRSTNLSTVVEEGVISVDYNSSRSVNQKWNLIRESGGDNSGVFFYISDAGVVSYTSDTLAGTGYNGLMKFQARALLQS